ncbi:MAG: hypothetical protein IPP91_17070 [Betaproteobacteria bacterium]|nr:hypothetical protein [Betaproteobacteria bacterium]
MNVLETIGVWGVVAGLILGLLAHINLSPEIRAKVKRQCLRTGMGAPLVFGAPLLNLDRPSAAPAMIAIGLIVAIPMVVGVVLWFGDQRGADV